jgi:hypothetical protein
MHYFLSLSFTLTFCLLLQVYLLHLVGGRTTKSESNFFSSMARIQNGACSKPSVMLLGSSITGRFPDSKDGFIGVANMGCDGSNAVDILRAIDQQLIPAAKTIVIEGNTLFIALGGNDSEISKAIRSSWFNLGMSIKSISSTARPAAFLYSHLLAGKIGRPGSPIGQSEYLSTTPFTPSLNETAINDSRSNTLITEVAAIIDRLEARGSKCLIIIYPPKIAVEANQYRLALAVAAAAEIPFWDLAHGLRPERIAFTDGVHMTPNSAALVLRELIRKIGRQ